MIVRKRGVSGRCGVNRQDVGNVLCVGNITACVRNRPERALYRGKVGEYGHVCPAQTLRTCIAEDRLASTANACLQSATPVAGSRCLQICVHGQKLRAGAAAWCEASVPGGRIGSAQGRRGRRCFRLLQNPMMSFAISSAITRRITGRTIRLPFLIISPEPR